MNVKITATSIFERQVKRLCKKYPSLKDDLLELEEQLLGNPLLGTDLGNGIHKIRLSIRSKGKGKSSGARVITQVDIILQSEDYEVCTVAIYDKSEVENLSKADILKILEIESNRE